MSNLSRQVAPYPSAPPEDLDAKNEPPPQYSTTPYPPHMGYNSAGASSTFYPPEAADQPYPNPPDVECSTDTQSVDTDPVIAFTEKSIRLGFIKKVFGILSLQLLITAGVVCIFLFVDDVKHYAQENAWMFYTLCVAVILMMVVLGCCDKIRRKFPLNITFLLIFTLAMSCLLGTIAGAFEIGEILTALGVLVAITLVIALFGVQSKFDFTLLTGLVIIKCMVFLSYGFLCLVFQKQYASMAYACSGALVFSLWLLLDIQLVMGGERKHAIDPEEYIFAALQIYIDIIFIFVYLSSRFGLTSQ